MNGHGRARIVYVSYDGAGEPLGRSQVVAYLRPLARDFDITLVSFEKRMDGAEETRRLLDEAGVAWEPLLYHKRPPVLSTLWDIAAGARAVRRLIRAQRPALLHARSTVPGVIALLASPRRHRPRFLYDIRAFWVDERVVAGSWRSGSALHRLAKRCELWCFHRADAIVTLTEASTPVVREWAARPLPVRVIPTCAELWRYAPTDPRPDGPRAVWCGSIGAIYRFDLAVAFARAAGLPLTVLTRQVEQARAAVGDLPADIREVAPEAVAGELRAGDIGLCFYAEAFANLARAPTRFAEYLAAGMVVAASPGIGDLDAVLHDSRLGVTISDWSAAGLADAARTLRQLGADPATHERARTVARERYSAEDGAREYHDLYAELTSAP